MATSALPSQGPHGGKRSIGLHHPCLPGVPMVGRNQEGHITPAFSGSPWWVEMDMLASPVPSRGPHGEERSIWLHHPCLLRVPMSGRDQYSCITPFFAGSPWWGEINMATSRLPSQVPHGGERSIGLHHPFLLGVPMVGRKQGGYNTPTFSRSPWQGGINMATSPLPPMVGRDQYGCIPLPSQVPMVGRDQ